MSITLLRRRIEKAGLGERKMRVIVYMQIAHLSPTRANSHAWEGVLTGRPHAGDARASRPHTPQGHVNYFGHMTHLVATFLSKLSSLRDTFSNGGQRSIQKDSSKVPLTPFVLKLREQEGLAVLNWLIKATAETKEQISEGEKKEGFCATSKDCH